MVLACPHFGLQYYDDIMLEQMVLHLGTAAQLTDTGEPFPPLPLHCRGTAQTARIPD
jgi:hypothetical protein